MKDKTDAQFLRGLAHDLSNGDGAGETEIERLRQIAAKCEQWEREMADK